MAETTLFQEWVASNENNKYPFSESATLTNGADFLPPTTFLDATIYPIGGGANMRLSKILIDFPNATFFVGDRRNPELASGTIDLWTAPSEVLLADEFNRPAGMLLSEASRFGIFQTWALGDHEFTTEQTEFCAAACTPTPELGFRGFLLDDGTVLTNDIMLIGSAGGVVLTREDDAINLPCSGDPVDIAVIRVDIVGDPLARRKKCEESGNFVTPRFIKSIRFQNGGEFFDCAPGDFGGIMMSANNLIASDSVLRVRTLTDQIIFEAVGRPLSGGRS
jgi:hypothetical protein